MGEVKLGAMRRVLEIFTEAGWISNSLVTEKGRELYFTPTAEGLEDAPRLLKLLEMIDRDPTGQVAASVVWLCRNILASDNYLFDDDQQEEWLKRHDPLFREQCDQLDREKAQRERKEQGG